MKLAATQSRCIGSPRQSKLPGEAVGGPVCEQDCLVQIGKDVANVLDADGEAHQFGSYAGLSLLRHAELLVRGGGGMDDQRLGVADVGQMREELDAS